MLSRMGIGGSRTINSRGERGRGHDQIAGYRGPIARGCARGREKASFLAACGNKAAESARGRPGERLGFWGGFECQG